MKKSILLENAARPVGPYSHAVLANGFVFISGQGPANPQTQVASNDFREQARQVFENVKTILEGVGVKMIDVVKVNAYLTDMANFKDFNEIYREYFSADFPVRTTIGASELPGNHTLVEVDCIAVLPEKQS
jgi:2-iminobutanoate/2-iminopropanoate deaminase